MTNKSLILIAGDVFGQFSTFFKKLKVVNKRTKLDFVICAGNFFLIDGTENEDHNLVYIAKEYDIGLQIYVLGPTNQSQKRFYKPLFTKSLVGQPSFEEGYDIAVNVRYLGKKGIYSTVNGFKIAYLSGLESEAISDYTFKGADIDELIYKCSSAGRIDLLLTTSYPYLVNENSMGGKSNYLNRVNDEGSILVSKLAKNILPRYHFSASAEEFYEREPYRNHLILNEQPKLVTRFISIAKVREPESKPKWLYAINLAPAKELKKEVLTKQPDDATENPYINLDFDQLKSIKKERNITENGSFFFESQAGTSQQQNSRKNNSNFNGNSNNNRNQNSMSSGNNMQNFNRNHQNNQNSLKRSNPENIDSYDKRPKNDSSCWFCLASPKVEKHLILSIGDHSYLALAKGGLVPHHFLIIPISHKRWIADLEIEDEMTLQEIGKYKNAIIDYLNSKQEMAVFFERNYKSGHWYQTVSRNSNEFRTITVSSSKFAGL